MPDYRRLRRPGGTYFFTLCLRQPGSTLLTDNIALLRAAYRAMQRETPVICHAMVILPDHLHAIWTLPDGDDDFPGRWQRFKARVTHALDPACRPTVLPDSLQRKREAGIWQRRYWEHCIRDTTDMARHMEYCRTDPVRHGLVRDPRDWPHSSLRHSATPECRTPPLGAAQAGERGRVGNPAHPTGASTPQTAFFSASARSVRSHEKPPSASGARPKCP